MDRAARQRVGTAAFFDPKPEYWDVAADARREVIERPADQRTLTKRYTEEAVRFIEATQGRTVLPLPRARLPHVPLSPRRSSRARAPGIFGDVVEELDWCAGRVLDALRSAGIDRRTLVVFTSDNGPWLTFRDHGGSAGPLREGKGSTWEGGMRAPGSSGGPARSGRRVTEMARRWICSSTAATLAGAGARGPRQSTAWT